MIDELTLDVAPVLFGSGERLFDGVESFGFEPVEVLPLSARHAHPLPAGGVSEEIGRSASAPQPAPMSQP